MDLKPLSLSDDDFQSLADLVHQKAGINLKIGKKEMVRMRLGKRIREGGFPGFRDYFQHVIQDQTGDELVFLLDAISTNLTSFFRESKHFDFMRQRFLPDLEASRKKRYERPQLRIWSAGCSTGEEPYSIAITVLEHSDYFARGNFKVLGTDISTKVLKKAHLGLYPLNEVTQLPYELRRRYFQKGKGAWEDWARVAPVLKSRTVFRRLNLMEPWPFRHRFDLIFCRNVMIYFDKETQAELAVRLFGQLVNGGYLFIGHSESLSGKDTGFKYVQPTVYRK